MYGYMNTKVCVCVCGVCVCIYSFFINWTANLDRPLNSNDPQLQGMCGMWFRTWTLCVAHVPIQRPPLNIMAHPVYHNKL